MSVKVQEVVKTTSLFADVDTEKYNMHDNDADVLIRMNCKLFVLDKDAKDQAIWTERGYGILKMIDTNDGLNSKISVSICMHCFTKFLYNFVRIVYF